MFLTVHLVALFENGYEIYKNRSKKVSLEPCILAHTLQLVAQIQRGLSCIPPQYLRHFHKT